MPPLSFRTIRCETTPRCWRWTTGRPTLKTGPLAPEVSRSLLRLFALAIVLCSPLSWAQEIEPRAYSNVPLDMNFLVVAYAHATGSFAADPSLPLEDAELKTDGLLFGYARSFGMAGNKSRRDGSI